MAADRALAVGAADLDERVAPLGVAERVEQRLDALEARAHARVLAAAQGEEPGHGLGVRHASGRGGWSAKKARRRRSVSLQLAALDDEVELAVLEQELRALEALGQRLADRLRDHARARRSR